MYAYMKSVNKKNLWVMFNCIIIGWRGIKRAPLKYVPSIEFSLVVLDNKNKPYGKTNDTALLLLLSVRLTNEPRFLRFRITKKKISRKIA